MRLGKPAGIFMVTLFMATLSFAQETFPVNGVADKRSGAYAFVHANIVKDANTTLKDATLVIREGRIVAVGANVAVPADAVRIDCKDKYLYPSFIDIYSDYGITVPQRQGTFSWGQPGQITSNTKGAYGWNQAIKSEVEGEKIFANDESKAKPLREACLLYTSRCV